MEQRKRRIGMGLPASPLVGQAGKMLAEAENETGSLVHDMIAATLFDPDPSNPRDHHWVNHADPASTSLDDDMPGYKEAEVEWEAIQDLANSIRHAGLRSPIEVFRKDNGRVQIVHGHRRYFACRLAGLSEIPVRIVPKHDVKNALSQWTENYHRTDLSLQGKLRSFRKTLEMVQTDESIQKENYLSVMGMRERQFRRYRNVAFAPQEVLQVIADGYLANLIQAEILVGLPEARRSECVELLRKGETPVELGAHKGVSEIIQRSVKDRKQRDEGGRPPKSINTKPIKNVAVMKTLFERLGYEPEGIDWDDLRSVTNKWQEYLDKLTLEVLQKS